MEATFIAKLLTVIDIKYNPFSTQEDYLSKLEEYKKLLSYDNLNKASLEFEEKQIPIPPEMQLVFNLEVILDKVYKRAKKDAKIEIMAELEINSLNEPCKVKQESINPKNERLLTFDDLC